MWWSKQADGSELSGEFSGELARRDKTASTPPVGMSPSESAHSEPDQCACPPRAALALALGLTPAWPLPA